MSNNTLDQVNEKFNDDTYPVFPFISKTRITILPKGLYRKHKATFKGITAIYDANEECYKYPLYGMYNIENDLLIVPKDLLITPTKQALLDMHEKEGFIQVEAAPKFATIYYPADSEEAELALANKIEHQTKEKLYNLEKKTQLEVASTEREEAEQGEINSLLNM